jgi:hypothetical protein
VNDGLAFRVAGTDYLGIIPAGTYNIDTILPVMSSAMNAALNNVYVATKILAFGLYVIYLDNDGTPFQILNSSIYPNYSRSAWDTLGFPFGRGNGPPLVCTSNPSVFVETDLAYTQTLFLNSNTAVFSAASVGQCIFFSDQEFIDTHGVKGNQLRLLIQSYVDSQNVIVTPNTIVIDEFRGVAISNWARAIKQVTGLRHIFFEEVSVWADRYTVGSPLNPQISNVYTVDFKGNVTLDKWYSVIYVGLPMISDIESLDVLNATGEVILAKRDRVGIVTCYVYNTRTFFAGTENPDDNANNTEDDPLFELEEFKRGTTMDQYDQPPELTTDQDYVLTTSSYSKNGKAFIRNVDPCPVTILAINPQPPVFAQSGRSR